MLSSPPFRVPFAIAVRGDDGLALAAVVERLRSAALFSEVTQVEVGEAGLAGRWSCVVWDAGLEPAKALTELADAEPGDAPVLMLVPDADSGLRAVGSGARGMVLRDASPELLIASTLAVAAGAAVVDPAHLALLRSPDSGGELSSLTPREREVLDLLAQGLSNRSIAAQLAISEHTAKFHVTSLMGKLGAQKRVDAVVRAARLGIINL